MLTASDQIKGSTRLILWFDSKSSIIPESLFRSRRATFPKKLYLPKLVITCEMYGLFSKYAATSFSNPFSVTMPKSMMCR